MYVKIAVKIINQKEFLEKTFHFNINKKQKESCISKTIGNIFIKKILQEKR
jgi:hypothetical protein